MMPIRYPKRKERFVRYGYVERTIQGRIAKWINQTISRMVKKFRRKYKKENTWNLIKKELQITKMIK